MTALLPVAVHEAGHAVAACALRIAFECVVLTPAEPRICEQSGRTIRWAGGYLKMPREFNYRAFKKVPGPNDAVVLRTVANCANLRKRYEDRIVVMLAGREADQLFGCSAGFDYEASTDYKMAREIAKDHLGASSRQECDDIIAKLRVRAARLLEKNYGSLILIASALDERGMLTAREVRALY